jgi:hypothetical protein
MIKLQSSYQVTTIASNVEREIQRLKAQVDLFWEKESKHYVEFGLRERDSRGEDELWRVLLLGAKVFRLHL